MIFANLIVVEEAIVEMAEDSVGYFTYRYKYFHHNYHRTEHIRHKNKMSVSKHQEFQMHPIFDIPTIVVLCSGTAIKLVLFLICRVRASTASQCLAIDHRNDCITNMVALAGALIGSKWWKYADPIFGGFIRYCTFLTWKRAPILVD